MRAPRKAAPKTAPRIGPRCAEEEPEVGPGLELELGLCDPVDPDEDGAVTFVIYM